MNKKIQLIPVMFCFFAMGFVDLVGIASNYVQSDLGLSDSAANIFPSLVFFWFLIFSVPTQQFRSANSVPRDLSLIRKGKEVILKSTPSPEVEALRGNPVQYQLSTAPVELFDTPQRAYELVIRFNLPKKEGATFVLSNETGEQVVFTYDPEIQTFSMDRRGSGNVKFSKSFAAVTTAPAQVGGKMELRLLVDSASIDF